MTNLNLISIEVVYGTPDQQTVIVLNCKAPITIFDAIIQSGIVDRFPEIRLEDNMVGVFGYRQPLNYQLAQYDRVEIYRPLHLSPTEARKIRADKRRERRKERT